LQSLAGLLSLVSPTAEPAADPAAEPTANPPFPFEILIGTSASALNTTYPASSASEGLLAFTYLANFWGELGS
jgi:NTE family protein